MNVYIADKVSDMGSDGFRIVRMAWFGPWDPKKFYEMQKRNPQIRPDEFEFVKSKALLVKDVGMMASRQARVGIRKGSSTEGVDIEGVTDNIPTINNVQVDVGRGITYEEVRRHAAVAFIGNDIRTRFFEGRDPIGKTISVEGNPYEVIGAAKALGSVFGSSQDNFVMIPIEAYFKTYGSRNGIRMIAKAIDQQLLTEAEDEARVLLRIATGICGPEQDDQLHHLRLGNHCEPVGASHFHNRRHGGGHRFGIHDRGRNRDHEYHAGGGYGAHARDRHSQIAGRATQRYSQPVPGGIGCARWCGRLGRRLRRVDDCGTGSEFHVGADGVAVELGLAGRGPLIGGGVVLRNLSGATGVEARPHRSATGGKMIWLPFYNGISLALQTIRSHKMRAFLTVLGVIIGTGTIIGVGAILTGFDSSITAVLRSFGPNSIIVFKFPVGPHENNLSPERTDARKKTLPIKTLSRSANAARAVEDVSSMLFPNTNTINVHYKGNDMYDVNLIGVEEAYARGGQVDLHLGRFFHRRRKSPPRPGGCDRRRP